MSETIKPIPDIYSNQDYGLGEAIDFEREEWKRAALCADPAYKDVNFFLERGESSKAAKQVCAECDVQEECLNYAEDNNERFGIWGGKSRRKRQKINQGQ